ncbi:LuxR C-terminal-related transcriptional regulator [Microbacterium oxydans]|uniref:LuxR C-terminal-related transcriptional regulator n=1 Tax=Microbacterium oxydans TaxID=82380 RepID=UPI0024ACF312|nr:LuxR C-terminal-related transcriptional regulator [Microbacterium oxydans]
MQKGLQTDQAVRSILDAVASGVEVRLLGEPLSGKSTTVRRLDVLAGDVGLHATTVRGIAALRMQPFGALTAAGIGTANGGPASLHDALAELAGPNRILIIDDVGDIDAHSLGTLEAAAQRAGRPLITTGRATSDFDAFDSHRPAMIVRVPGATYVDTLALIGAELGGRVTPGTVRRVHGKSGGLPGLATHLVRVARLEGSIRIVDGVWTAANMLWRPSMQGLVAPFFEGLSRSDIEALRALSAIRPAYAASARESVGGDAYDHLLRRGRLREFTIAGSTMFTVFPPLIVEYFRSTERSSEEVLEYSGSTDVAALSSLAQTDWRREVDNVAGRAGTPASPSTLLRPLRMSLATGADIDPARITRTLTGTSAEDASAKLWEAFIWIVRGDEHKADRVFSNALAAHPDLEGFVTSARAHAAFALHSDADAANDAPAPGGDDLNADGWAVVRAETALAGGRIGEARSALDQLSNSGSAYFASLGDALDCVSLLIEGRLDEAAARSLTAIEGAIERYDLEAISMYGYAAAVSLYTAGRDDELLVILDLLLSIVVRTPSMHGGYTQGVLGCAASQSSDDHLDASAEELAAQMASVSDGPGAWPFASSAFAVGLVRNTAADFRPAAAEAEHHLDNGLVAAGLVHEAIIGWLQPGLVDAERVDRAIVQTDSPLLQALGRLALAATAGDGTALIQVSDDLAALGAHRAALGARISIAVSADPQLQPVRVFEALTWALESQLPLSLIKKVIPMRWIFTEREIDIVTQASAGRSTRDIAAHLAISGRTVEGHLSAIYRKIGISSRAELPPSELFS